MKKRVKNLSRCVSAALSLSMVLGNIAAPLTTFAAQKDFVWEDEESDPENESKFATPSNAVHRAPTKTNQQNNDKYPDFGTDAFWDFFMESSDEELEEWFETIKEVNVATDSDADYYPEYVPILEDDTSDFYDYFMDELFTADGINYDKIKEYAASLDFEDAYNFLSEIHYLMEMQGMINPLVGDTNMFPQNYGGSGNSLKGTGTKENPYQIEDENDLRLLAYLTATGSHNTEGKYYELTKREYDLDGQWIPIGFAPDTNSDAKPFEGHISSNVNGGSTILDLAFDSGSIVPEEQRTNILDADNLGLFGYTNGATIENINVETTGTIEGNSNVGILVGYAVDTTIRNCDVEGHVKADKNAGGLVGYIESSSFSYNNRSSVIEDCDVVAAAYVPELYESIGKDKPAAGGVAGKAENTIIADVTVKTFKDSGNHIYAQDGYAGGIVGWLNNADIYNSYVTDGQIGSQGSYAVGGIVGGYEGGEIKVARFAGDTVAPSSTNRYHAAFIGTKVGNADFTYGSSGDIAYLFTDDYNKANTGICGTRITEDGEYGLNANIGYWHDRDNYYTLLTGDNTYDVNEYFYTILEDGIMDIIHHGNYTQEGNNKKVIMNHYTSDESGRPTRGYLLTVLNPMVGGNVASELTAYLPNYNFAPHVTQEMYGAFAPGATVYVTFDDQKQGNTYYKLNPNESPNPYYIYHTYEMFEDYVNDNPQEWAPGDEPDNATKEGMSFNGGYYFTMPEADTVISAEYQGVATSLSLDPSRMQIHITQERSGDRTDPDVSYNFYITDGNGTPITDGNDNDFYNSGEGTELTLNTNSNPQIYVDSYVNGVQNDSYILSWQVSNRDVDDYTNHTSGGHGIITVPTATVGGNSEDAYFRIELDDSEIANIVDELEQAQIDNQYKSAIPGDEYFFQSTISAQVANADETLHGQNPPIGYLNMEIFFHVDDETRMPGDGVYLNKDNIVFNIDRTIQGDRTNYRETWKINGENVDESNLDTALRAVLQVQNTDVKKINWYLDSTDLEDSVMNEEAINANRTSDDAFVIEGIKTGLGEDAYSVNIDLKGLVGQVFNPDSNDTVKDWVDNDKALSQTLQKISSNYRTYQTRVKVTITDSFDNNFTDACNIIVNYRTIDNTAVHPTDVEIVNKQADRKFDLSYTMTGDINSEIKERKGFDVTYDLNAEITPEYQSYMDPYNDNIVWSVDPEDTDIVTIDSETGVLSVLGGNDENPAPWIEEIMSDPSTGYVGQRNITVYATAQDSANGTIRDSIEIPVTFRVNSLSVESNELEFDLVLTQDVYDTIPGYIEAESHWSGDADQKIVPTTSGDYKAVRYEIDPSSEKNIISVADDGTVSINKNAQWIKDVIANKQDGNTATKQIRVNALTNSGVTAQVCFVTVNFRYDAVELNKNAVTLDVLATQGNNTIDQTGTLTWEFDEDVITADVYSINSNDEAKITLVGEDEATLKGVDLLSYNNKTGTIKAKEAQWMRDIIETGRTGGNHSGSKVVYIIAESPQENTKDVCKVTINFRYDNTVLDKHEETYNIVLTNNSRTNSPKVTWTGIDSRKLNAIVFGEESTSAPIWTSSDDTALTVNSDGLITPVQNAQWMQDIINAGKHSGTKVVTVTASNADGTTVDTATITLNFRYDETKLSSNEEVFNIVMTQTRRTNDPDVFWTGNKPIKVDVEVWTAEGKSNNAVWEAEEDNLVVVDQSGNITPVINAQWMKDIVAQGKFEGQMKTAVNAYSLDKNTKDSVNITINFKYENVVMSENTKTMDITLTASGRRSNPTYTLEGDTAALSAVINSINPDEKKVVYTSSNTAIITVDQNGKLALVKPMVQDAEGKWVQAQGTTFSNSASDFLKEAMKHSYNDTTKYITSADVVINAASEDGRMSDQCNLKVNVKYINNTYSSSGGGGGGGGGGSSSGGSSSTGTGPSGSTTQTSFNLPSYVLKGGNWLQDAAGNWYYENGRTFTNEWAAVQNPYADTSKGQPSYDWFHFGPDSVMDIGWYTDENNDTYYLHPVSDNTLGHMYIGWQWIDDNGDGIAECYYFETQSNGYRGRLYKNTTTPDGYTVNEKGQWVQNGVVLTRNLNEVPAYVLDKGTWTKTGDNWYYDSNGRRYNNEWAALYNPYADTSKGQSQYDWFHFGTDSAMDTGWLTVNGHTYYLNTVSDGTLGRMFTGWNNINEKWYYFDEGTDATKGQLWINTTTPDGHRVDSTGARVD